ncbi:MAG: hypothetical protein Q8L49_01695 [Burkholderiaceae bacterium]|nr:hypothetical protein [Burkholderiaceae bacterium]
MTGPMRAARTALAAKKSTEFEAAAAKAGLTVQPGKSAVKHEYRSGVAVRAAHKFHASVDLDADLKAKEPGAHRWDYGLGLVDRSGVESAWWVEPHPASSTHEVTTMLAKLDWLNAKLKSPEFAKLQTLTNAARLKGIAFRWLAMSGEICIRPDTSQARRLAVRGLAAPTRHVALP